MILNQLALIIYSPLSRLLILACSSQIASMITKLIITSIRAKKISFEDMANYGGMPSSHTVFVTSFTFGIALDHNFGWNHPFFTLSLIISAIILIDTIRFRGTVDKLNDILKEVVEKDKELKQSIKFPKHIAHSASEVVGGIIFSFLYTITFYLFLYRIFPG
ncbi:MAG: divergent PAP2 family protein [Spirochaetes bacterium]|nr:divergent PAP2 family protein [Spirochaetota bacterium]